MHRFYFLLLIQLLISGKMVGQKTLDQQHEKFIRLHRTANAKELLQLLETEQQLFLKKRQKNTQSSRAKIALDQGIYYYMIDEYQQSIPYFHQADKSKALQSHRDRILLYTYLGVSYQNARQNFKQSHFYLDKAIGLAEQFRNHDLLASAVIKKTNAFYLQDKYTEGVDLLEHFFQKESNYLNVNRKLSIHSFLIQGYTKLGNYAKSYQHHTAAIDLAKTTNDEELISDHYYNFILYFLDQDRHKEAKAITFKVIDLLKGKPGWEIRAPETYATLAQIYSSLQKPDSALYFARLSLDKALTINDPEILSISYATLGHVYGDQGNYTKSLNYLFQSIAIEEQLPGLTRTSDLYHNAGVICLKMKNFRDAITYFEESNRQAYLEKDVYTLLLNYGDLAKSNRSLGNAERALVMQDSFLLYYDSMNNIEKTKELVLLETRYNTKLKEQENKILKLRVKRQNDTQRNTIILGIIVITLLLLSVYALYINNRLKKSKVAEAVAKIRTQELEQALLHNHLNVLTEEIHRKNKLIQSLENDVNSISEESLLNKVTLENDWLAFMTEFDKLHSGYLSDLKQRIPDLTTNNLRLAALVKLEFSNKEIANILNITENGVKKAKQRLKERVKTD